MYRPAVLSMLLSALMPATQADSHVAVQNNAVTVASGQKLVAYPRSYFDRYQPLTALDMVRQVPGFQLENNIDVRGYSDALGNLLINDRRPTAKQDQPLDILARIPADTVERIELIRSQVRDINMLGQSSLVNVIIRENVRAAVQWDAYIRKTFRYGGITPKASFSLTHQWRDIDYNLGLGFRRSRVGKDGTEDILGSDNTPIEARSQGRDNLNTFIYGNLNASSWFGNTFVQINSNFNWVEHIWERYSIRVPEDPSAISQQRLTGRDSQDPEFELGLDLERHLAAELEARLIMLFFRGYVDSLERQRFISPDNTLLLLRQADTYNVTTEAISRVEFDWTTLTNHTLQANFELAWNVVDGKFNQTDDDGTSIISVAVPGSNSRVEELRGDLLLQDTWSMGQFELDYGLGAELSRISQSGDIKQSRHFSFIKPELSLLYTPAQGNQTRARLAREVAHLNLDDFISATVFEDDDLALGNPDLRPDTSWVAELSHERRFGRDAVIKATLFHHWINDVLDLLPLSAQFEAPGNIGDGRRWGIELESTLPLQWLGLIGARLKLKARWQDSTVTDPITGEPRVLSANNGTNFFSVDNEYAYSVDFRQDSQVLRAAWGLFMQERAKQPLFKVNELEINDEGTELNLFVETTRWLGIKMRIDLENVLDYKELRNRTVYVGERQITAVRRFERLDETGGPRVFFTISGSY